MSELNAKERIAALSPEKRELLLKKLMEKQKSEVLDSLPQMLIDKDSETRYLPFEFTEVQQVYWMGQSGIFDLSSCSTNIYSEYEVAGLNGISRKAFTRRLEKALNLLIERHDMLRAVVLPEGFQKILKEVPIYHIKCVDLRGKRYEWVQQELERVRNRMRTRKGEISQWPLFELRIHYLEGNRTLLHIQLSALLVDGTSRGMFIYELFRLTNKPSAVLPRPECSYRDYAVTWSKFKNSNAYKKSREHWMKKLPEMTQGPVLPLSRNIDMETATQSEILHIELFDKEAWSSFSSHASKFGLSGSSALLGAYVDMIAFWSTTKKFSLGVINTYRPPIHPKIEDILGNFNTMQIVTADVLKGSFIERTEKLQQQVLYNIENPYFSGPEVLREFNRVNTRSSKTSLPVFFNSVISHTNGQNSIHSIKERKIKNKKSSKFNKVKEHFVPALIKAFQAMTRFLGISLDIRQGEVEIYPSLMQLIPTILEDRDGTIICKWQGVKNLFPEGVLKKMAEDYQSLLKRFSEQEETWHENWGETISKLSRTKQYIASPKDQTQSFDENLNTLFFRQVIKEDGRPAIIIPERTITYRELYCDSNRIANLLQKNGVKNNTTVAVMMDKSFEQIAAILGILEAGAAFIPVDINISDQELKNLLVINSTSVVITQTWIAEKLEWPAHIQRIYLDEEDLSDLEEKPLTLQYKPEDLACIFYNGDAIENSRYKRINHRMISNVVLDINQRFDVNFEDKLLSLYTSISEQWLYDVLGMLTVGGTIVLPHKHQEKDFSHWSQLIQREQITIWNTSPILLEELITYLEEENGNNLNSLRLILLSNERISGKLLKRFENVIGHSEVVHLWGASEAAIWSMFRLLKNSEEDVETMKFDEILCGQRVYILNEALQQCPVWTFGNIYIGQKNMGSDTCFYNSTKEMDFAPHSHNGEALLRTKYIGRYTAEGYIEVAGEEKYSKLYIGGYFILPHQVESKIELHPEVRLSVVRIEEAPNNRRYLAAYVVRRKESTVGIKEIQEFLKEKLPYYMIPTDLVVLDSIPLNLNGRVNDSCLKASCSNFMQKQVFAEPLNDLEARLVKIWQDVLDKDEISIKDNFFDLGGDSLKVLKMSCLIEKEFDKKITPANFFVEPTIEQLASELS